MALLANCCGFEIMRIMGIFQNVAQAAWCTQFITDLKEIPWMDVTDKTLFGEPVNLVALL